MYCILCVSATTIVVMTIALALALASTSKLHVEGKFQAHHFVMANESLVSAKIGPDRACYREADDDKGIATTANCWLGT